MRQFIAPGPITPVLQMGPVVGADGSISYSPEGALGANPSNRQYTNVTTSIVAVDGSAGDIAAGGKMTLQNCGTAAVYVKRGTGASSSSFNWVLSACSAQDDGLGGSVEIADFIGNISIDGVATPRVAVTNFVS